MGMTKYNYTFSEEELEERDDEITEDIEPIARARRLTNQEQDVENGNSSKD